MSTKTRDRFFCNPGSQLAPIHSIRIDDNGHKTLVDTGEKTDIYAKIVSHKDEVDIELLLRRCEAEGYQILDRQEAVSGDVTLAPKSLLEAQQILQDQENTFNQLPLEIRKEFNFNFNEYIAEASNNMDSWGRKMRIIKDQQERETAIPPEIKNETSQKGEE